MRKNLHRRCFCDLINLSLEPLCRTSKWAENEWNGIAGECLGECTERASLSSTSRSSSCAVDCSREVHQNRLLLLLRTQNWTDFANLETRSQDNATVWARRCFHSEGNFLANVLLTPDIITFDFYVFPFLRALRFARKLYFGLFRLVIFVSSYSQCTGF